MKHGVTVVSLFTLILISTMVGATTEDWTNAVCLNDTHLLLYDNINFTSSGRTLNSNTLKVCSPYICNNNSNSCENPYQMNYVQSSWGLPLYIILFLSGVASLFIGLTRKHIIFTMWASISFLILAMQSIALETIFYGTFFSSFTSIFVMLSYFLTIVSFIFTMYGLAMYVKGIQTKNQQVSYAGK